MNNRILPNVEQKYKIIEIIFSFDLIIHLPSYIHHITYIFGAHINLWGVHAMEPFLV